MTLDELIPLNVYGEQEQLTSRQVLAKALGDTIEIYYVFDRWTEISYLLDEEFVNGKVTVENYNEAESLIVNKYKACDTFLLTPDYIRVLWRAFKGVKGNMSFVDLFYRAIPEGYSIGDITREYSEENVIENLFVNPLPGGTELVQTKSKEIKSSNTALKVIGLLMNHLAKNPKFASGTSPNKSQIKELLLDLAEEQQVNAYGLSKVDERLLVEAMKYLESQKL